MAQLKAQVDKLLTDVSNGFFVDGLVAEMVLPLVVSTQKTGKLGKYGTSHLRIEHSLVGGRGQYRRVESIVRDSDTYSVESHGLSALISEDDYKNVELPFLAEQDETLGLTNLIQIVKEKALADALTSTSTMTLNTTLSGTSQFSDYANSDPLGKFSTARSTVRAACGMPPNLAILDWAVADKLAFHPGILEALGYTQARAGQLSPQELAKAMGVEKILIAKGVYETANEGQTSSLGAIWGKHIVFAVAPDRAMKYMVSLGYRVALAGQTSKRVFKNAVTNPPNSTEILVDDSYDFLLQNVNAGYLIKDAIA